MSDKTGRRSGNHVYTVYPYLSKRGYRVCRICRKILFPSDNIYRMGPMKALVFLCEDHRHATGATQLKSDFRIAWSKVVRTLKRAHSSSLTMEKLLYVMKYLREFGEFHRRNMGIAGKNNLYTIRAKSFNKAAHKLYNYVLILITKHSNKEIDWRQLSYLLYFAPTKCNFHIKRPEKTRGEKPISARFV